MELPKGWINISLDHICKIQTGKFDANHAVDNGKYRFYTCAFEHTYCNTNSFSGESIILPGNGANVGEVFYYTGEFEAYQRTYILNSISCFPKYLFYKLKHNWNLINKDKQYGSATNYIRMGNFTSYDLPLPPLPEQGRIVEKIEELFSELDNGVEQLKKAKEQIKTYRQAVLKAAFEGRLSNEDLKENDLPNGWKWLVIGDICSKVEYGSSKKSEKEGKVPVLRMGNIQNRIFDWTNLKYSNDNEEIKKYKLNKGDVLFNRTNSPELVGKTAVYLGEREAIFAGYLIRIHYNPNINPKYLNFYLNSTTAKNYGHTVKTDGVNQSNINGQKLKSYPFPFCEFEEQNRIVSEIEKRFSVADKLEESIDKSLQQAEAMRQSILKKAFEGKLVPQDTNDEPADKLLERIKKNE